MKNRIFLFSALLVIAAITILSYNVFLESKKQIVSEFEEHQLYIAKDIKRSILKDLYSTAQGSDFLFLTHGNVSMRDILTRDDFFKKHYKNYIASISFYNQNGALLSSNGTVDDQLSESLLKELKENNNNFIVDDDCKIFKGRESISNFIIYLPLQEIRFNEGTMPVIMAFQINAPEFFGSKIINRELSSKKFGLWIIDKEGNVLFQSDHAEMQNRNINSMTDRCLNCHIDNSYIQKIFNNDIGHVNYSLKNVKQKDASFTTLDLNNEKWKIVVTTPSDEITKYLTKAAYQEIFLIALILLFITGITTVIIINSRKHIRANEKLKHLTEKNELLKKIIETEGKYKELFDNNPVPMWVYSVNTLEFVMVNDAAIDHYGYSREEFLTMTLKDIRPEEEITAFEEDLSKPRKGMNISSGSWLHRKKDGTIINVEIISHSLPSSNGQSLRLVMAKDITKEYQLTKELKESESRFRDIANLLPITLFEMDLKGNLLYLNEAGKRTMRADEEDIHKTNVLDYVHPKDRQRAYENFGKNFNEGSEYILMKKDGSFMPAIIYKNPIKKNDKVIGFRGIIIDNTERNNAIEALKESEDRYRTFINSTTDLVFLKDQDFRYLVTNQTLAQFFGKTVEEMIGLNDFDLVPEEAAKSFRYHDKKSLEDNVVLISEETVRGRVFESTKFPVALKDNKKGVGGIVRDVTERKKAEAEIKMLAHSIAGVQECVSITDNKDKIIFVNESFLNTYGYTREEVIGKHVNILRPKNVALEIGDSILSKTIDGGWKGEILNQKKDGTIFPVLLSTSLVKDDNDNVIALIGVATDITEQKRSRQELIQAKEKAEEMSKLKSNFLANMSHELRTPMIGVLGFSEILKSELKKPDQIEMAEEIYISGQRLLQTLNLILDLSRIEANKMEIRLKNINIKDAIISSTKIYEPAARNRNLYLKMQFNYNNVFSLLDESLLIRIINNLLTNALKFTKSGGIVIELDMEKNAKGCFAVIKVIDTGIGIAEEDRQIIFEEFRQASEGLDRSYEGTGLGLTLTKKSVELMNGTISVESELGKGSTFYVKFPATCTDENNDEFDNIESKAMTSSLPKLLLVENDSPSSEITRAALKGICELDIVENGEQAVEYAGRNKYPVILMDIGLGYGMNGIEATKIIRTMPGYDSVPIVALTAYAMENDKELFLSAGLTHYLSKPFKFVELKKLITEILAN